MKITPKDFVTMQSAILDTIAEQGAIKLQAHRNALLSAYPKDKANNIYRWNVLFAVPQTIRNSFINLIYQYADDTHIETALRKIIPLD